jgi:hypothetical protein
MLSVSNRAEQYGKETQKVKPWRGFFCEACLSRFNSAPVFEQVAPPMPFVTCRLIAE